jgi:CheY-like chemotaxis protein
MQMAEILVVEDEPAIRMVLREVLEMERHTVREASNGEEALASLKAAPPDVVLLDLFMPRIGGREVVERMRRDPLLEDVPVVLLTGALYRESDYPPNGSYYSVIMKPFDLFDVIDTINRIAGGS